MVSPQLPALHLLTGDRPLLEESPDSTDLLPSWGSLRIPIVPGLRGSSANRLLPVDLASCRDLSSGLSLSSTLANVGARSTRTLDAVDVDTLADVAKLRRHPGHSLLRLIVVGDDVLEDRTSDENQLTTIGKIN